MNRTTTFLTATAAFLSAAAAQGDTTLGVASSEDIGQYIVGPDRMPVYAFTADTQGNGAEPAISCTSQACLAAWPLVTVESEPTVGPGLDASLVGSMDYDGQTVATYNGWPLYTFVRDEAGQPPQGNHVESFGGEWYLLDPAGEHVEGEGH